MVNLKVDFVVCVCPKC